MMKKLVLSLVIASSLGLTACDSETVSDVKEQAATAEPTVTPIARVVFDPAADEPRLSVPNDLLFQGTQDGTLSMPVAEGADGSDPYFALSTLDGWSIAQPFVLDIDFPEGRELDGNSVFNPNSVRVFEAIMGGDSSDANCASVTRGFACKVVGELTYTEDFVTQKSGNSIAVVPLKPLKPKTTYLVVLTDTLQDSSGKAIAGSSTYELVKQDITTNPLATDSQKGLQALINSFENAVEDAGVEKESIIYSFAMTTQSTTDVLTSLKGLMANNLQNGQFPVVQVQDTGLSVADVLASRLPAELLPMYSTANYLKGSITLPYYMPLPSAENPTAPTSGWMKALCDSGAMLAGLAATNPSAIPAEPISETDATCMAISQASGLPAPGLRDLGIDSERNLTKFNPIPAQTAMMPIEVQMTTPDYQMVTAVRAALGLPELAMPENGWPLVILQHGITSNKEAMLMITGMLSLNGFATAAIDFPMHGSRGFDHDGDGNDDLNAGITPLHYINLASLLTVRDNLKQSAADMLGLRLGLNFMAAADTSGQPMDLGVNSGEVHFMGISWGSILGMNMVSLANSELNPAIDPMFEVKTAAYSAPGLMFANFAMESPAFELLAKSNLAYGGSPDFKAYIDTIYPNGYTQEQLNEAYTGFYASLTPEQQGQLDGVFAQFTFVAQTLTDSGDPIGYIDMLAATNTPTYLAEVVGNGMDNLPDQVVTNTAPFTPLGGTEPIISLLDLPSVSETSQGSGAVRFIYGHHGSVLSPAPDTGSPDQELSFRTWQEMQSQIVSFLASMGQVIQVNDTAVVKQ
ncbi:VolA/Pla-1 family phospholipase [Thalassotalea ganghwensis]